MTNDFINNGEVEIPTCPTVGYQSATVCVPVTVTPFAKTGIPKTKCCGDAIVTSGKEVCSGIKNGSCSFTISQNICVAVPVEFGATSVVGDSYIECNGCTEKDICSDCSSIPEKTE